MKRITDCCFSCSDLIDRSASCNSSCSICCGGPVKADTHPLHSTVLPPRVARQTWLTHWAAFATPCSSPKMALSLGIEATVVSGPGTSSLLLNAIFRRPLKSVKSPLGANSDPGVPLREDMRGPFGVSGSQVAADFSVRLRCRRLFHQADLVSVERTALPTDRPPSPTPASFSKLPAWQDYPALYNPAARQAE